MKYLKTILIASTFGLLSACFQAPEYSDIPEITFVGLQSTNNPANQGDSVILIFNFQDGGGDLGKRDNNDTVPNLFLTDRRFNLIDSQSYSIPNIPQLGSVPDITGEVRVNLQAKMFCNPLNPGAALDTIIFDLRVRDRAGNFSNEITIPPIIVRCN